MLGVDAADYFTLAGYTTPNELPDLDLYLRTKYPTLRQRDIKEFVALITDRADQSAVRRNPAVSTRSQRLAGALSSGGVA